MTNTFQLDRFLCIEDANIEIKIKIQNKELRYRKEEGEKGKTGQWCLAIRDAMNTLMSVWSLIDCSVQIKPNYINTNVVEIFIVTLFN